MDWSVTSRHYARWIEDSGAGRVSARLGDDEVWPDLLARVRASSEPEVAPNAIEA
jgi:hypothetical protein